MRQRQPRHPLLACAQFQPVPTVQRTLNASLEPLGIAHPAKLFDFWRAILGAPSHVGSRSVAAMCKLCSRAVAKQAC
jgi:hypothetical protein